MMGENNTFILLTRPEKESRSLAEKIKKETELNCLVCPVMEIRDVKLAMEVPPINDISACVFTSAHAVRVFLKSGIVIPQDFPIFAIGEPTAHGLKKAGYTQIYVADGSSEKLCEKIARTCDTNKKPVLHFCGVHVSPSLQQQIISQNLNVRSYPLYEAIARTTFPKDVLQAIKDKKITDILFYSERTVRLFVDLCEKYRITEFFSHTRVLCLSQAMVKSVKQLPCRKITVAHTPSTRAMLDLLGRLEHNGDDQNE